MTIIEALKLGGAITGDQAAKLKSYVIAERESGYASGFDDACNLIGSRLFMGCDRKSVEKLREKMNEDSA